MSSFVKNQSCHIAAWLLIAWPVSIWGQVRLGSPFMINAAGIPTPFSSSFYFGSLPIQKAAGHNFVQDGFSSVQFKMVYGAWISPEKLSFPDRATLEHPITHLTLNKENKRFVSSGVLQTVDAAPDVFSLHSQNGSKKNWQFVGGMTRGRKAENLLTKDLAAKYGTVHALAAPTNPVTDDEKDTFDWTYCRGYTSPELYEYTLDGGTLYQPVTAKPQPVGNTAYPAGQVGVRVRASATNDQSATLFNEVAFLVASENLLPYSDFGFGFPFYLYNCSHESAKNIPSPVKDPGTYYKSSANGAQTEIRVFQYPNRNGEAFTYSMYIKPVTIDSVILKVYGSAGGPMSEVTLQLSKRKVVSNSNASGSVDIVSNNSNGWYRVSFTYVSSTNTSGILRILFPETASNQQKTFYLAGAQLNRGTTSGIFVAK
jgi:hypothetical protein